MNLRKWTHALLGVALCLPLELASADPERNQAAPRTTQGADLAADDVDQAFVDIPEDVRRSIDRDVDAFFRQNQIQTRIDDALAPVLRADGARGGVIPDGNALPAPDGRLAEAQKRVEDAQALVERRTDEKETIERDLARALEGAEEADALADEAGRDAEAQHGQSAQDSRQRAREQSRISLDRLQDVERLHDEARQAEEALEDAEADLLKAQTDLEKAQADAGVVPAAGDGLVQAIQGTDDVESAQGAESDLVPAPVEEGIGTTPGVSPQGESLEARPHEGESTPAPVETPEVSLPETSEASEPEATETPVADSGSTSDCHHGSGVEVPAPTTSPAGETPSSVETGPVPSPLPVETRREPPRRPEEPTHRVPPVAPVTPAPNDWMLQLPSSTMPVPTGPLSPVPTGNGSLGGPFGSGQSPMTIDPSTTTGERKGFFAKLLDMLVDALAKAIAQKLTAELASVWQDGQFLSNQLGNQYPGAQDYANARINQRFNGALANAVNGANPNGATLQPNAGGLVVVNNGGTVILTNTGTTSTVPVRAGNSSFNNVPMNLSGLGTNSRVPIRLQPLPATGSSGNTVSATGTPAGAPAPIGTGAPIRLP